MPCLSDECDEWLARSRLKIEDHMEAVRELDYDCVALRDHAEGVEFLCTGNELIIRLREALISGYRERNRNNDESVPALLSPGQPADVPVSAGRLSVGGEVVALLNSVNVTCSRDGRVPPRISAGTSSGRSQGREVNHTRPPAQEAFVPAEYCRGDLAPLTENQVIRGIFVPTPLDNLQR